MLDFVFKKSPEGLRPEHPVPSVKTDLRALDPDRELLVWFGHSSYLFQLGGKRILVDPVFCGAAPVSFLNKPFPGTEIYRPEDMPDIDCLVITHDHWDHLDYGTVTRLKGRSVRWCALWAWANISSTGATNRNGWWSWIGTRRLRWAAV